MAYQLSDIVTRVQNRVKDSSFSSAEIKAFINDTQRSLFNEYDIRLMETTQDYTLTIGDDDITSGTGLPTNFVKPISLRITTNNYEKLLPYIDYKEVDARYPDISAMTDSTPMGWYFFGNEIKVLPEPDQAYVVQLRYLKRPTTLSNDSDVPELPSEFEELLVYGASYRIWEEKDRFDKAAILENKYLKVLQEFVMRYGVRQTAQPTQIKSPRRRV